MVTSIQDRFMPEGICYGCGPANARGLALRSVVEDGIVVADWQPQEHHGAMPGVLCGGVIGTLLDCHSGAVLAHAIYQDAGRWPWSEGPGWATAEYTVRMLRPTPLDAPLRVVGTGAALADDEAVIDVELHSQDKLRATCTATWRRLRPR